MRTFSVRIYDLDGARAFPRISSFVGEDASGNFGILAGHARLITTLVVGLARMHGDNERWQYLAMPGATLYFENDVLTLSARRCVIDDDYSRLGDVLQSQQLEDEQRLQRMKESLHRMEDEILRRLWHLGRGRG